MYKFKVVNKEREKAAAIAKEINTIKTVSTKCGTLPKERQVDLYESHGQPGVQNKTLFQKINSKITSSTMLG